MRVATWNVNGLGARLDFALDWLRVRQPDVVGLQELKLVDERFPHDAFAALGYRAAIHGQKSWNGVAILARSEPRVTQVGLPGFESAGARLLTAEVDGLSFTSVYVPNGKSIEHADFPAKLAWLDGLAAHLARGCDPSRPAVVCGDFNVCPGPLDSWNESALAGSIFHTPDERARIEGLLRLGLIDLYRELHPGQQAFSWWDYRGGAFHRKQGLRIDLLLATRAAREGATAAEIDRDWRKKQAGRTPSDHAPVWADLLQPAANPR
jgi:exodeoxyribonuclease-3